jgi:hypothetical protein
MNKFRFGNVDNDNTWDEFVKLSPQGNVFFTSAYLSCSGVNNVKLWILKGNQIKAGLCLILDDSGNSVILDDFVIYSGLMLEKEVDCKKVSKVHAENFEIIEFCLKNLVDKYKTFAISLSPNISDMRPFLWLNYHTKDLAKCEISVRYTSYIDISELFLKKNDYDNDLFNQLDSKRQADIKKGKKTLTISEEVSPKEIVSLYSSTLSLQDVNVSEKKSNRMVYLIDRLCEYGYARKYGAYNSEGDLTYAVVFTIFNNEGVYLFGAGDNKIMNRYDGSFCIWSSFHKLSDLGVCLIDMEGINSPKRGQYKLSFGGDITPYYEVKDV